MYMYSALDTQPLTTCKSSAHALVKVSLLKRKHAVLIPRPRSAGLDLPRLQRLPFFSKLVCATNNLHQHATHRIYPVFHSPTSRRATWHSVLPQRRTGGPPGPPRPKPLYVYFLSLKFYFLFRLQGLFRRSLGTWALWKNSSSTITG